MQTGASDFGAVAEIDFDNEATSSGYDAFADLVQMAVREDPSLASVASTSGNQELAVALHSWTLQHNCFCVHTCARSLSDSALQACTAGKRGAFDLHAMSSSTPDNGNTKLPSQCSFPAAVLCKNSPLVQARAMYCFSLCCHLQTMPTHMPPLSTCTRTFVCRLESVLRKAKNTSFKPEKVLLNHHWYCGFHVALW